MIESLRLSLQNILGISGLSWASFILQVVLILIFLSIGYVKFVKNSPAEKTVKGIVIFLMAMWLLGELFSLLHLRILAGLLRNLVWLIILSGVVIFQPELRRIMALLGNQITLDLKGKKKNSSDGLIQVLSQCILYWRKHKTGALIVFENKEPIDAVTTGGVRLDAIISSEMLINLFFVNTPLHDGAVIIKRDKIVSAGVILPLTKDATLSWKYGTRHRAAIGLSEETDALCLVVSEETGDISFIQDGKITTFDDVTNLDQKLMDFMTPFRKKISHKTLWQKLKSLRNK